MRGQGFGVISDAEALNIMCRESLGAFTCKSFGLIEPAANLMHNWHIDCISEHLEAVWNNEIRFLIINMPPRSLKTHTTSVAFPAWAMGKDPTIRFMLTSFKSSLAEKMTRKTRMIMKSEWYQQCFPGTEISEELDRQYYFETTQHGQYFSSSMASVTGEGCDIQISDDPISPDEALSDTVRESTNETIRSTLFSRFNDPRTGRFILNMQRLHDDDPTGNLLKEQGWTHLKLPAEAKGKTHVIKLKDRTWTLKEGEMLFPARFTREVLDQARERLGEYNYAGQYLQEPVPIGGGKIKIEWIQYYKQGAIKPKEMNVVILVDPSGGEDVNKKKQKLSDWTAMMVVGLAPDNNYYLLDIIRDRLNPTERINTLFMLHRKWNELCGKPPKVGYEKISMQSDTHYITEKKRQDAYHFPLIELGGTMKKETRIERLIPDMQNGRFYFPESLIYIDQEGRRFDLVQEILNTEIPTFPRARYDDMLDALSRIYESELSMVFPKPKLSMTQKALKAPPKATSWKDF
jgi:predicted phage terminase large subunit-like protein